MTRRSLAGFLIAALALVGGGLFAHQMPDDAPHCKHCNSDNECEDYHGSTWNKGWLECTEHNLLIYRFCYPENPCPQDVPSGG